MSTEHRRRRAVALIVAALCAAPACSGDPAGPRSAVTPSAATSSAARREATVRALMATYETQLKAPIVSYTYEDGHLGVYLKPQPQWDVDAYIAALPVQTAAARALLAAVPEALDADVCVDGHWLPHKGDAKYSTATKVLLFRDRLAQVPADLATPAAVLKAALKDKAFDVYVDPKIQTESPAWTAARKEGR